jgi:hypothetical protein
MGNGTKKEETRNSTGSFIEVAGAEPASFVREFGYFLMHNKKWWLTPIILVLLLLALLIVLGGSAAAPFIYALF